MSFPPLMRHERLARLAVAGAVLAGAVLLAVAPGIVLFPKPACGFRSLTGLPCAFCGGTRATAALAAGDVATAARMNALVFPLGFVVMAVGCVCLVEALRSRRLADWGGLAGRVKKFAPLLVVALILWWVPHVVLALREPGSGLVAPDHPLVRHLRER